MESADEDRQREIGSNALTCPGGCVLKGPGVSPVLPGRAAAIISLYSRPRKDAPVAPEGAEPKLFRYAGRAPPLSA